MIPKKRTIKRPFLSVIIPAYNEALRIKKTLVSVDAYLSRKTYDYEIIVVDDGSLDDTQKIVKKLALKIKNLSVIGDKINRGKGYAVRAGMKKAVGKFRLFMDADNSVEIGHLEDFLKEIERGYDIVIGSIHVDESVVSEHSGWHRRLLGELANLLIRTVATPGIMDTQRGFKLFTAGAANRIFAMQSIERFGFDIELLVIAKKLKYKVKELPVIWDNPAGSKVGLFTYIETLRELLKITVNRSLGKYGV